jgi:hypothetical protein
VQSFEEQPYFRDRQAVSAQVREYHELEEIHGRIPPLRESSASVRCDAIEGLISFRESHH